MPYDGTPVASPTYVTGKWSQGVQFNGSTQRIDISSALDAATVAQSTYCVEFWLKLLAAPASFGRGVSCKAAVVAFNSSGQGFFVAGNGSSYTLAYNFADGNWHHFAVTLTGGTAYYAVDGTVVGTESAVASTSETVGIGAQGGTTGGECNCIVDEVRFSKVARYTVGPPSTSYTMPTGPFTADSDTLALYHFDGDATDSGSTLATGMTVTGCSVGRVGAKVRYGFTPTGGNFTGTATPTFPVAGTVTGTLTWAGTSETQYVLFTPSAAGSGNVTATGTGLSMVPQAVTFSAAPARAVAHYFDGLLGPGYSGLTGTAGVTVYDPTTGAVVQDYETANVIEVGTGTGHYVYKYAAAGPNERLTYQLTPSDGSAVADTATQRADDPMGPVFEGNENLQDLFRIVRAFAAGEFDPVENAFLSADGTVNRVTWTGRRTTVAVDTGD